MSHRNTHFEGFVQLVDLGLSRKERFPRQKLGKNAANRPHVDRRTVFLQATCYGTYYIQLPASSKYLQVGIYTYSVTPLLRYSVTPLLRYSVTP